MQPNNLPPQNPLPPEQPNPYYPARNPVPAPIVSPQLANNGLPAVNNPALANMSVAPSGNERPIGWIITVTVLGLLLLSALGFAIWAFGQRQDYKNNSDQKSAAAVVVAKKDTTNANNKRFAEELKNPLKSYTGPSQYGSVRVDYPKTWSAYIATSNSGGNDALTGYFHPDYVPAVLTSGTSKPAVALQVRVLSQNYDQLLTARKGYVDAGTLAAAPYALPKVPDVVGVKFTGKLSEQLNGTEIVLPLRDKTLIITTETDQFLPDFNTYILPNLTFEP